jgi:transcriptional regulator with XRE-family HTH domain
MNIREDFARNLRKLRHAKGLSQEALAYEAGVDRTYISALERGVYSATIDMVAKIAVVLGVEPAILLQRPTRSSSRKA